MTEQRHGRLPADYRPPTPRERFTVLSADGTPIAVEVHGPADAPTVVLGHGWTCSAGFWSRVLHRLGDDVRAVVYDQRGHGRSGAVPPDGFTERALADDLRAVLEHTVPLGRRAVVAGHSMGAMALVGLAGHHPGVLRDRVAAALLASTGVGRLLYESRVVPVPRPLRRVAGVLTRRGMNDPRMLGMLPRRLARVVIGHMTLSRSATRDVVAFCTDVVRACPAATRVGFARMLGTLDLVRHLPALDVPTLVLCGSRDRMTPIGHSRRMLTALPQAVGLVELDGAGHMTPVQTPDAVADAVRRLVREHLAVPSGGTLTA